MNYRDWLQQVMVSRQFVERMKTLAGWTGMKSALEVCMLRSIRMRLDSRKQLNANKHPSQLNHIPILNELQQAAHKHHNRFKHGRENHLVLQLLQIYSSPRHSSLTRLIVVLLLSRVTLLILHGVDFSSNRLQLIC